jgi:heme-degrading monooxygenase HmoA
LGSTTSWVQAFSSSTSSSSRVPSQAQALRFAFASPSALFSTTESSSSTTTEQGLLKRDRYIATNRFAVRQGKEAKFEQRWATRKSKLATLDGFKYFHLMRRVTIDEETGAATYEEGSSDKSSTTSQEGNYVSFTIWEKKSDFSAWRSGEAFKEAHGGTSIGAFMKTMVSSALVLKGAPKPAFYDGLLLQSITPESIPDTVDGWRSVNADGVTTLPVECFVACNQFFVPLLDGAAAAFEQRWAQRESQLKECEGFVAFSMLRRDGQAKGHGMVEMKSDEPTYMSTTIWKDQASFQKWRKGTAFSKAHGQKPPSENKSDSNSDAAAAAPPKPLWSRPPKPVFYEGTLVITREEGA